MVYGTDVRKDKAIALILGVIHDIKQEVKRLNLVQRAYVPKLLPLRNIPTKRLIGIHGTLRQRLVALQRQAA